MKRKKKIKIGIGISIIGITMWQFGLFHRFNYLTAKIDILNGNPQVVQTLPPMNLGLAEIELNKKYGFKKYSTHCTGSSAKFYGIDAYSAEIEKYLKKRNGDDWRKKYSAELDSLMKIKLKGQKPEYK